MGDQNPVVLDHPGETARAFPDVYDACRAATDDVLGLLAPGGYENLALHSPGLKGYTWDNYIELSLIRMARVARTLDAIRPRGGKLLDLGSYFGNFSLLAQRLDWSVNAVDSYERYAPALQRESALLKSRGVRIIDSSSGDIAELIRDAGPFQAVLLLGVIEHIPHTPRELLDTIYANVVDGGYIILDTPNLAYLYRREALARGESVFPPLEHQYTTRIPFEGHHREYTRSEIEWMLNRAGFTVETIELFNYSIYCNASLTGEDARRYRDMDADPDKREIIFAVARKPPAATESAMNPRGL